MLTLVMTFFLSMTLFVKNLLRNHLFERFNSKDLTKFLTENLRIGLEFYETQNADFLRIMRLRRIILFSYKKCVAVFGS